MKCIVRCFVSLVFVLAGIMHFRSPAFFSMIVPPGFGNPNFDVALSGVFEICGAIGMQIKPLRRIAAYGLVLLLLAVWPANWYMALHAGQFAHVASASVLWLRVPLQVLFIALVLWVDDTPKRLGQLF
jgi:uncharacterized membrane protein